MSVGVVLLGSGLLCAQDQPATALQPDVVQAFRAWWECRGSGSFGG